MLKILNRFKRKQKVKPATKQYIKDEFKRFFEGSSISGQEYEKANVAIAIIKFGITDVQFEFDTKLDKDGKSIDVIDMNITLERPGILIGKGGRVINKLERYLNGPQHKPQIDRKINVKVIESKIWS